MKTVNLGNTINLVDKDCLTEEGKYILNDSHSCYNNAGSRTSGIKESLETLIRCPVYPAQ